MLASRLLLVDTVLALEGPGEGCGLISSSWREPEEDVVDSDIDEMLVDRLSLPSYESVVSVVVLVVIVVMLFVI